MTLTNKVPEVVVILQGYFFTFSPYSCLQSDLSMLNKLLTSDEKITILSGFTVYCASDCTRK